MKACIHCKQKLAKSEFYRRRETKDGYRSICKACWRIMRQKNRYVSKGLWIRRAELLSSGTRGKIVLPKWGYQYLYVI